MAENNMNESYATRIRNFVLEQKSRDGIEPVRGQMLYDIDDDSIYYGKYDSGTESVNWSGFGGGMVEITYDNLKDLRDNGGLTSGTRYRITDYETTTAQEHTSGAGHQFDIIVTAIDESTLSEDAQACHHEFDEIEDEEETVLRTYYYDQCYRYKRDITFNGETCGVWELSNYEVDPRVWHGEMHKPYLCYEGEWVRSDWAAEEFVFNVSLVNNKLRFSNNRAGVTDMKDVEMLAFIRNDEPRTSWANEDYMHENCEVIYLDKINTKYFSRKHMNAHYVLETTDTNEIEIQYVIKADYGAISEGYKTLNLYSVEMGSNGLPRLYVNKSGYDGKDDAYFEYRGDVWYSGAFRSRWVRCYGKTGNNSPSNGESGIIWENYSILTNRIVGMELDNSNDTTIDIECRPSNLGAWTLKYSLDNDTDRFAWADTENGKGVIYYMRDEFGNEAPYDFKNIMYDCYAINARSGYGIDADFSVLLWNHIQYALSYSLASKIVAEGASTMTNGYKHMYTFTSYINFHPSSFSNALYDATLNNNEYTKTVGNVIKESYDANGRLVLPDIVFYWERDYVSSSTDYVQRWFDRLNYGDTPYNCSFNVVENNCHDIRLPLDCHHCTVKLDSHDIIATIDRRANRQYDSIAKRNNATNVIYAFGREYAEYYESYIGSDTLGGPIVDYTESNI